MLKNNVVYKHADCRTVAFLVLTCYEEEDGLMVSGFWVNVQMNPSRIIKPEDGYQTIFIQPEQIDRWEAYEE